ncbi:hypothetical protein [Peribacillus sp. SCS-37]|uniref:hypothetical protein n=1 Tax=Paraperibacillus esterisolvens TaxID=3115296 RepID=UPI003905E229
MKKLLISILLLLVSIIYLIYRITVNPIFLTGVSAKVKNPIQFNGLTIGIDTGFIEGSQKSIYTISLLPVYLMIIISLLLVILYLRNRNN